MPSGSALRSEVANTRLPPPQQEASQTVSTADLASGGKPAQTGDGSSKPKLPTLKLKHSTTATATTPSVEEETETSGPSLPSPSTTKLRAALSESQQREEDAAKENEVLKKQLEEAKATQAAHNDLHVQLEQSQQQQESLKKQQESLRKQLEEARAHTQSSSKKREFDGIDAFAPLQPPPKAKRFKREYPRPDVETRRKIQKDMERLSNDLLQLVMRYWHTRKGMIVDIEDVAEYVAYPSPELKFLYNQIFVSAPPQSWDVAQAGHRINANSVMMRLIAAHIFQSVFCGEMPWHKRASIALAGLQQYLETDIVDEHVRDASFRRINDKNFQDGEIAQYARQLAQTLTVILSPHLEKLTSGEAGHDRRVKSTEWVGELTELYHKALIIKATVDTYEGEIKAFWPAIGAKMDPLTADPPGKMHKHLPQEICGTEWSGLRWKVEGKEEIILARAQVAAFVLD